MTNEEAIDSLRTIIIYSENDGYTDKTREALKMAIEALEQKPVLDKIRAEIADLQKEYQEYGWAYDDALEIIDKYIEANKEE